MPVKNKFYLDCFAIFDLAPSSLCAAIFDAGDSDCGKSTKTAAQNARRSLHLKSAESMFATI